MNIVGAGLAGALLAIALGRKGVPVRAFEKRPDPRLLTDDSGRSINLALAARGMRGLAKAGVLQRVLPLLIPMRGRMVHPRHGEPTLVPYGTRRDEIIYSVSRAALGRLLIEAADELPNVELQFDTTCVGVDAGSDRLELRQPSHDRNVIVELSPTIAADGAGSAVRASLAAAGLSAAREIVLDHDYLELTMPAVHGAHALFREALHIWPRGGFMLIALPNTDGSFTATLFLARDGTPGFSDLHSPAAIRQFFAREFPTAVPHLPNLVQEFSAHPQGRLGTVYVDRWHVADKVLLLGDAAHAIVPFHGQGMNCAFEDVAELDALLADTADTRIIFDEFTRRRKPQADAIAQMALENYLEMRDTVLDPAFQRRKQIAAELERLFPDRFIPRYSMVMFHPEIDYTTALARGAIQEEILAALDTGVPAAALDRTLASRLVHTRLTPLGPG